MPIKRIAKTLISLGGWPGAGGGVRFFDDFWTRTMPYSPWLKDEHVQLSEMGFRRFWARGESCVVQKAPILVCSTGPVFAQYCIRRGPYRNPWDTRMGSCNIGPKIARTHREPGERMWQLHRRRVISYGLHGLHWPQPPMAPEVLRAGTHPWVLCIRPKHYLFYA